MILSKEDLISLAHENIICRNNDGDPVATFTPREIIILAKKGWIEGVAREGKKNFSGGRDVELRHVRLLVAVKKALAVVNRKSVKENKVLRAKADGSVTWIQVGMTTFMPHFQRCRAFKDGALRIGVAQA